jgi:hypothetical protein
MIDRLAAGALLAFFAISSALAQSTESYGVFCARGRVVVDSRSAEQMQSGQGACQLARFSDRTSAEGFARRNFGGAGGSCSCR